MFAGVLLAGFVADEFEDCPQWNGQTGNSGQNEDYNVDPGGKRGWDQGWELGLWFLIKE